MKTGGRRNAYGRVHRVPARVWKECVMKRKMRRKIKKTITANCTRDYGHLQ